MAEAELTTLEYALLGLLDNLEAGVKKLGWNPEKTAWAGYYQDDSYSAEGIHHKQQLVAEFIKIARPKTVWDLGANIGLFSRIASNQGISTVAWDVDPGAVDINFRQIVESGETHLLPLLLNKFLAELCNWLVIEFVPKEDAKVQILLATRDDIFPKYTQQGFEATFSHHFTIQRTEQIKDSSRILYLMRVKRHAN